MKHVGRLVCLFAALSGGALAQPASETLLQDLPAGYRIDAERQEENTVTADMVPEAETAMNWTEKVTTQIFLGMNRTTPEGFLTTLATAWLEACDDGTASRVGHGEENGYAFSIWAQTCPRNATTGKPEHTWFKAIRGNDAFYLVQKSFRFDPTDEQIRASIEYFRSVMVCDARLADRPCPTLVPAEQ